MTGRDSSLAIDDLSNDASIEPRVLRINGRTARREAPQRDTRLEVPDGGSPVKADCHSALSADDGNGEHPSVVGKMMQLRPCSKIPDAGNLVIMRRNSPAIIDNLYVAYESENIITET